MFYKTDKLTEWKWQSDTLNHIITLFITFFHWFPTNLPIFCLGDNFRKGKWKKFGNPLIKIADEVGTTYSEIWNLLMPTLPPYEGLIKSIYFHFYLKSSRHTYCVTWWNTKVWRRYASTQAHTHARTNTREEEILISINIDIIHISKHYFLL